MAQSPDASTVLRTMILISVMTDGPFIELKEHNAGFYVIIADDLDDALGWARKVVEAIESREIGSAMSSSIN